MLYAITPSYFGFTWKHYQERYGDRRWFVFRLSVSVGSIVYSPNMELINIPISSFSNRSSTKLDFYAPGENIVTYFYHDSSWKQDAVSGTSFSTAIVAAQLALYKNNYADLSNDNLLKIVRSKTTEGLITSVPH